MKTVTKDTDIKAYRREVIVRLDEKGLNQQDIADALGCSQGLVSQVLSAYREEGLSGIASQGYPGKKPKLGHSQRKQLKSHLEKGARKAGFSSQG